MIEVIQDKSTEDKIYETRNRRLRRTMDDLESSRAYARTLRSLPSCRAYFRCLLKTHGGIG